MVKKIIASIVSYALREDVLYHGKIDTPARDEWGYLQAKKALKKLVGGSKVSLEFEIPGKLDMAGYGRILAYVWVDDVNVNVEMVRLGWSRPADIHRQFRPLSVILPVLRSVCLLKPHIRLHT